MKNRVIGIAGVSGSGKDVVASILVEEFEFTRIAFADSLKETIRDIFEMDDRQLWGEMRNIVDARFDRMPREVFQIFGDTCRSIWPEIWIKKWERKATEFLSDGKSVVCSDMRTRAEVNTLKSLGAENWLITRNESGAPGELCNHKTEREITSTPELFDRVIENNGSLDDLKLEIESNI
jgi:ABC-type glutathione transport system ATPase component